MLELMKNLCFLLTVSNSDCLLLRLVVEYKAKCYCSFYNSYFEFLFIQGSFGVMILCLRVSFLYNKSTKPDELNVSRKLVFLGCVVVWVLKIVLP